MLLETGRLSRRAESARRTCVHLFYLEQVADHRTHRLVYANTIRHQSLRRCTTARNKRYHQQAGKIYRHYDVQEHHKKRNADCLKDRHSTIQI